MPGEVCAYVALAGILNQSSTGIYQIWFDSKIWLEPITPSDFKNKLSELAENPTFIRESIISPNSKLFKIKEISGVQDFMRKLSRLPHSSFSSWSIMSATGITQVIGIDRVSDFNYYRQTDIKGSILGDYSHILSAIYILDDSGILVRSESDNTPLDRAFRFIHNIKTSEYALIEVSHHKFIQNPSGWADGLIIGGKLFRNALLTDYSGNFLSSLFFHPETNKFALKTTGQFNSEFLSNKLVQEKNQQEENQRYGINLLFAFSKSDINGHLNALFSSQIINPVFAPDSSIYHYELLVFKDYFENINKKSLLDFRGRLSTIKGKESKTYISSTNTPPDFMTKEQFFKAFLKLFDLKTVFSPAGTRGITTQRVNDPFIFSILGDVNMIFNPETGYIDPDSKRTGEDFEGIINKIFKTEDEMKQFLFLKEQNGELVPVHKNDYNVLDPQSGESKYISTIKQWLHMMFDKIANIPDSELGGDRVSKLVKEARDNLRELCPEGIIKNPLDVSHIDKKNNELDFSITELGDGKSIYKIVSRLMGHFTLRLVLFHMINFYNGKYRDSDGLDVDGFKIDITTRRIFSENDIFLNQFGIISPTQDDLLHPLKESKSNWDLHLFTFFFGNSYIHLPIESGILNENNRVEFGYSPLPFFTEALTSTNIDYDINKIFWAEYLTHYSFLYEHQGFTSKLRLFIQSGNSLWNAIQHKLSKYALIPEVTQELVSQLLDEAKEEVFRVGSVVTVDKQKYKTIRIQIESFLKSNDYCREIIFYKVFDENGESIKISFTKDDFRGYFIINFGHIKSNQFSQKDVNEFFISYPDGGGEYFRLEEFYSSELIEKLRNQGIDIDDEELVAITRAHEDNKIVWLDRGTPTRGFRHILDEHADDFDDSFDVYMSRDIAKFIFQAISSKEVDNSYDGRYPGSKVYVYRFGANYLHVVVADDRFIVTAYPSPYIN